LVHGFSPDLILSSCSLRTQETADGLGDKLGFKGPRQYLQELYLTRPNILKDILIMQENKYNTILVVGHNPQITELISILTDEHVSKVPTLGVVALNFDVDQWSDIEEKKGEIDFFISPNQFKYYMPKAIRSILDK